VTDRPTQSRKWCGEELPEGLSVEAADRASALIAEYENSDFDGSTVGAGLDNPGLVVRLFRILCSHDAEQNQPH
jgi:hypothetical protein